MRILYVFNWWESVTSVAENSFTELVVTSVLAACGWLARLWRHRRRRMERAVAARVADRHALEGIPLRMKAAVYRRMGPATAEAKAAIMGRGRVGEQAAAQRAEKAVNNAIAWLLGTYRDAGRLGRLRLAIGFPFVFKAYVAQEIALLERGPAPEVLDRQELWAIF